VVLIDKNNSFETHMNLKKTTKKNNNKKKTKKNKNKNKKNKKKKRKIKNGYAEIGRQAPLRTG
jgi:hypothetical protein